MEYRLPALTNQIAAFISIVCKKIIAYKVKIHNLIIGFYLTMENLNWLSFKCVKPIITKKKFTLSLIVLVCPL